MSDGNINIQKSELDNQADHLIRQIQTDIIEYAQQSKEKIENAIENSSGDFMDALKETLSKETKVMEETGEFLIAVIEYVKSAAAGFEELDQQNQQNKVSDQN